MNVVGKVGNLISQGVAPFHPFGGAVDIIVVQQQDGSFRTTPWYVRFGKFQGVLKRSEKLVRINVNGVEANFHMYLDNSGEAYFSREVDPGQTSDGAVKDGRGNSDGISKDNIDSFEESFETIRLQSTVSDPGVASDGFYSMRAERLERSESDVSHFYDFQDDQSDGSIEFPSEYGSNRFENLDGMENFMEAPNSESEVVLVSVDGHILTAPITSFKQDDTEFNISEDTQAYGIHNDLEASSSKTNPVSAECVRNNSDSSIEQSAEPEKEDVCHNDEHVSCEVDFGSLDKDQDNHEQKNQVIDNVLNQESDLDVNNNVEGARFSAKHDDRGMESGNPSVDIHEDTKNRDKKMQSDNSLVDIHEEATNGGGDMQSENSLVDIHEETKNGDGEMQSEYSLGDNHEEAKNTDGELQSEKFSVDIHEEAQEKPIQNLQKCDADAEHTPDNYTRSIQVVEARYEDDVRIENGSAFSFTNSTSAILNGEVQPVEEFSTGEEPVLSNSSSDGISSDSVDEHLTEYHSHEAEISIQEVEHGAVSSLESQAHSDLSNNLTAAEPVSDDTDSDNADRHLTTSHSPEASQSSPNNESAGLEISLCGHLLHPGMGLGPAAEAFDANRISAEEFKVAAASIIADENLVVRLGQTYLPWDKAAHIVLGMAVFDLDLPVEPKDAIPVEQKAIEKLKDNEAEGVSTPRRRWRLWPMSFRRSKTLEPSISNVSSDDIFLDPEASHSPSMATTPTSLSQASHLSAGNKSPHKKFVRTNIPTSEQIASLNLKDGQNVVTFSFCTRVWGSQQVEAHIYLWKWNARIVISDVDGTITRSDVLGQFMPLVGRDWSQSGVAKLFSAIKENGYQLLFLSARAIVQAYLTKSFLVNLKQDGKTLPDGPVVISPDGLFPSLFREVIRRAPHEFKIACLQDIKALFPADYNPFYAGFGNRDTDELSYRKIGIPKGKIFIINPKGEVAISHRIDVKSYTSLHTLVNDMFPPTSMVEQEDYNHWNYWKMPMPDVDDL